MAASLALEVASSLANFAAALAPSGPVKTLCFPVAVDRVAIGASSDVLEEVEGEFGESDCVEEEGEEIEGEATDKEVGGTEVEGCRR